MNAEQPQLATLLSRHWWVLLLRGIAAIAFGILTWILPGISLVTLVILFGAYCLADGALGTWSAITGRKKHKYWWLLLIWALISIAIGLFTLVAPGVTALALLLYIACWAIATGIFQIVSAIRVRKEIEGEWWLILAGVISVAFGVLLIAKPDAGALALLWMIASYAVILGVLFVILAFKMRGLGKTPPAITQKP